MTNTKELEKKIKNEVDIGMGWEDVWFLSNNHSRELFKSQKYGEGDCDSIAKALKTAAFE